MIGAASRALLLIGLVHGWGAALAQTPDTAIAHPLPALSVEAVRARSIAPPVATKTVDCLALRKAQASNIWEALEPGEVGDGGEGSQGARQSGS